MKLSALKEEHLVRILELYEKHCGFGDRSFRDAMHQTPGSALEYLKTGKNDEYRIGSRWDSQSKIYFGTDFGNNVVVRFYPNFDPEERDTPEHKEAEQAGEEFARAAMEYLAKI